jgi:hypothetical protein
MNSGGQDAQTRDCPRVDRSGDGCWKFRVEGGGNDIVLGSRASADRRQELFTGREGRVFPPRLVWTWLVSEVRAMAVLVRALLA